MTRKKEKKGKLADQDRFEFTGTDRFKEKIIPVLAMVEQSSEGMALADLNGNLVFVNKTWCEMHGYENPESLLGRNLEICHSKEQIENDVIPFNKKVKEKGKFSGEVGHQRKDGSLFPTLMTTTLLKDLNGTPYALAGIAKDISEQHRAEKELRLSEEKYRKIFENVQDVFYKTDKKGILTDISPSIERHTGYKVSEVIGRYVYDHYLNKEDRIRFLKKLKDDDEVINFEAQMLTKENDIVYTSANAHYCYDNDGNITGLEGSLKDISESKRAEEKLRQASDNWDRTFRSIRDGIALLDRDHHIVQFNRAFQDYVGKTKEEILGNYCFFHVHGSTCPIDQCPFVRMKQSKVRESMEMTIDNRVYEMIVDPISDEDGNITGAVHIMSDITRRKQTESELLKLKEDLESQVAEKTKELKEKLDDLERFFKATIDRELRMKELFDENRELKEKLVTIDPPPLK